MRAKPKIVQDIHKTNQSVFRRADKRINLSYRPKTSFKPAFLGLKGLAVVLVSWMLILGTVAAPTVPTFAATSDSVDQQRTQLQQQLQDLENQINQYEGQITAYQTQGSSLKGEIGTLNSKIAKLNLQVKAIQLTLNDLNLQIGQTQNQITVIQGNIDNNKVSLGDILRNLQATEGTDVVEILLRSQNLSDFFNDVNNLTTLQDSLRQTIQQISDLKGQLQDQKDQLVLARADAATIQQAQQTQRLETQQTKQQKDALLQITKGQEAKYQQLVVKTKAQADQIRSRIFQLLGGGQMTFGDAYKLAQAASDATGVRAAFLLAILDRESALGKNVGKCSYRQSMNPKEWNTFFAITKSVGIDPETQMVSCANADGVYGGAIGPAQFLPSTWQKYAAKITAITGNPIANPWNSSDAFIAAALYVKDAGAATDERMAAAKYYCGGNWNRYVCTEVYGRRVVEEAASFQNDINDITS